MRSVNRAKAVRREFGADQRIPYLAHVAPWVLRTEFGDYLQTFRLGGASFETNDDAELNNWHERLNVLWRNVAASGVALWVHTIRRPALVGGQEQEWARHVSRGLPAVAHRWHFADHLHQRYQRRVVNETLMQNEIFLSVLLRPVSGSASGVLSRLLARADRQRSRADLEGALEDCEKLAETLSASLARYEPERLGCYRQGSAWNSSLLEFLGLLVNSEWQRMPLPRKPLNRVLASGRLFFGTETIEYRTPSETRVGAMLGIKEYPTPTTVGMYNSLLSAPISFVLTQSFAFLAKSTGQGLLQRQFNRLANAGDFAVSQAADLKGALDALTSNEFVMGDHHLSLQILARPDISATASGANRLKALNDDVALARSLLADTGMLVAREDLALEAAFWAQLPGNFAMRPRKAPVTSRNLAAMAPFHNFPAGRAAGNHWGDALTLLVTSARSPYYFSLHASDPTDPEGGSRKDTGHTLICGPTGSGKTVLIGYLIAMLARQGVTQVVFDKDRGLEILVRALGGDYFPLQDGIPTGFNPLQLAPTPANVEFLKVWLSELSGTNSLSDGAKRTAREQADLDQALRGTLALEVRDRCLSRLVEFLDRTDPEGLHARLSRWSAACGGDYAWVFDNAEDSISTRVAGGSVIGFDVTEFLSHPHTRAPITLYLFHLVRQLLDGRRLACWMDEFWRLLADSAFEKFAKDGPKTWRKLNGVMCLATQSTSDILASPICRTLVEQTPTKVFFPNADADHHEYTAGFGLTEREFRLLKDHLEPGSRMFLVKQAHHSVVCRLDLRGFEGELAVISGRIDQVARMNAIITSHGPRPEDWVPAFMRTNVEVGAPSPELSRT